MSIIDFAPPSVRATFARSWFADPLDWVIGLAAATVVLPGCRAPAHAVLDYLGAVEWAYRDLPESFASLIRTAQGEGNAAQ